MINVDTTTTGADPQYLVLNTIPSHVTHLPAKCMHMRALMYDDLVCTPEFIYVYFSMTETYGKCMREASWYCINIPCKCLDGIESALSSITHLYFQVQNL